VPCRKPRECDILEDEAKNGEVDDLVRVFIEADIPALDGIGRIGNAAGATG
jgi:hypothetical protein